MTPTVLVLPALHLGLCIAVALEILPRSEWSNWFIVYLIDFPISIFFLILRSVPPLLSFGVLGTAWWFLLSYSLIYLFRWGRSLAHQRTA